MHVDGKVCTDAEDAPNLSDESDLHHGRRIGGSVLISLADSLQESPVRRHLLFGAAAGVSILLLGYHFGAFDQSIHIPFLKKFADPGLYPGNEDFFKLRFQHYSYFWFLFLPLQRAGLLEPSIFVAHVLATYLTFWAVWTLSMTLFRDPLAGLISVFSFIVPHFGFSGFPTLEWSLLNRTAALPFLLWTINLFLLRRYATAFVLLGLLANIHILSAAYAASLFLLDLVRQHHADALRRAFYGVLILVAGAAPVLLWRFTSPFSGAATSPEWFPIISQGMFFHLFHLIAPYPHVLLISASGAGALGLFMISIRRGLSVHDGTARVFIAGTLIIIATQLVVTHTRPLTILIQSQIMRVGLIALILGYLYFSGHLAARHRAGELAGWDFACPLLGAAVNVTPVAALGIWTIQRFIRAARWRRGLGFVSVAGSFVLTLSALSHYRAWIPGVYLEGRATPWRDAQVWARDHTPRDAVFITPLHLWWLHESDWRVFSERSQVVSLSDLLEIALVPDYVEEWKRRFDSLAPGALARFRGDYLENLRLTKAAYESLSDGRLAEIAGRYGVSYVVVEKPQIRTWPVVYENQRFVIYRIDRSNLSD